MNIRTISSMSYDEITSYYVCNGVEGIDFVKDNCNGELQSLDPNDMKFKSLQFYLIDGHSIIMAYFENSNGDKVQLSIDRERKAKIAIRGQSRFVNVWLNRLQYFCKNESHRPENGNFELKAEHDHPLPTNKDIDSWVQTVQQQVTQYQEKDQQDDDCHSLTFYLWKELTGDQLTDEHKQHSDSYELNPFDIDEIDRHIFD